MRIGIGHSSNPDPRAAALEAVRDAKRAVPKPDLAVAFGSIHLNQEEIHKALCEELDPAVLTGGSSYAEISNQGVLKGSVAVLLLSFERSRVRFASARHSEAAEDTGAALAAALGAVDSKNGSPVGLLFSGYADGVDGRMLRRFEERGGVFSIFGGATSTNFDKGINHPEFYHSYCYAGDKLDTKACRLALLELPKKSFFPAFGFGHGWNAVGEAVPLTRCEGSRIYEVNGEPVFDFYARLFGRAVDGSYDTLMMQRYAISVEIEEGEKLRSVIKLPVKFEPKEGWIEYVPSEDLSGKKVRLVISNRLGLIEGARRAAARCQAELGGKKPAFLFVVSCCTRSAILHGQQDRELEVIREVFGRDVPVFGYYSGGEYFPAGGSASGTIYHSSTVGVFALAAEEPLEALNLPVPRSELWSSERLRGIFLQTDSNLDSTETMLVNLSRKSYEDAEKIRRQSELIRAYTPHTVWEGVGALAASGEEELHDAEFEGCFLFLDVKGFTAYSEANASRRVVEALNGILSPATEIVYAHGGDVDKFIGDCLFAAFPDARRAVSAARDLLRLFKRLQAAGNPFSVRIGINGGRAVRANVGSPQRREYTYIGDAVNLAQRLESNCGAGRVLIAARVYEESGVDLVSVERRRLTVKGRAEPVDAVEASAD